MVKNSNMKNFIKNQAKMLQKAMKLQNEGNIAK